MNVAEAFNYVILKCRLSHSNVFVNGLCATAVREEEEEGEEDEYEYDEMHKMLRSFSARARIFAGK